MAWFALATPDAGAARAGTRKIAVMPKAMMNTLREG
jgi:hypothetical protein